MLRENNNDNNNNISNNNQIHGGSYNQFPMFMYPWYPLFYPPQNFNQNQQMEMHYYGNPNMLFFPFDNQIYNEVPYVNVDNNNHEENNVEELNTENEDEQENVIDLLDDNYSHDSERNTYREKLLEVQATIKQDNVTEVPKFQWIKSQRNHQIPCIDGYKFRLIKGDNYRCEKYGRPTYCPVRAHVEPDGFWYYTSDTRTHNHDPSNIENLLEIEKEKEAAKMQIIH